MSLADNLRRGIAGQVVALFNDQARGQRPVVPAAYPYLPADSVAARVHGDVTAMMAGGVAALLLQMLHPSARAGVWDHSNFRRDMLGRLRNTARFIAVTTYGSRPDAEAAIARVRRIHAAVRGVRPDGVAYRADDPRLLAFVHVAGALPFLDGWIRYGEPRMSRRDQDAYFADVAPVALALGADPVPTTLREAQALLAAFRSELSADGRSREIARLVLNAPPPSLAAKPFQTLVTQAGIGLLPAWARRMHGLPRASLLRPAVSGATFGLAETLRWAFARPAPRRG